METVKIFDTTLRDGQQCPGAGMSFKDNITYAHMASDLGVDVLEAGFPSASKLDFEIVNTIAKELTEKKSNTTIAGLCQLREAQIDITIDALSPAIPTKKARVHTYLPVDPELLQASLGSKSEDKDSLTKEVFRLVKKAVDAGCEVEFSPEGYSRVGSNFDWCTEVIFAAIEAGATTINCPDTIGGAHWTQGEEYYVEKMNKHAALVAEKFPNKEIIWSCHNHNDFGTAVENSINAVLKGPVRQIECTINGIGERAGNASMEQCVMILKHYGQSHGVKTNIHTEKLQEVSDFIADKMLPRQPHFPVTGDNSAKHTSGGHTNAILKNPLAYQPFDPKEVGNTISFVFGPLSGGNHSQSIIQEKGYICEDSEKAKIAQFIKDMYADRRKGITDVELIEAYIAYRSPMKITNFDYSKSVGKAGVHLDGEFFGNTGTTENFVEGKDSALTALKKLIDSQIPGLSLQHYSSKADSETVHAQSIATIILRDEEGNTFEGNGRDEDIEISALKAMVDAANRVFVEKNFRK